MSERFISNICVCWRRISIRFSSLQMWSSRTVDFRNQLAYPPQSRSNAPAPAAASNARRSSGGTWLAAAVQSLSRSQSHKSRGNPFIGLCGASAARSCSIRACQLPPEHARTFVAAPAFFVACTDFVPARALPARATADRGDFFAMRNRCFHAAAGN